ncbi:MAG TPA: ATP-dependent protease, partial [Candidatus Binatia bacterium]|nr:ATP-dependent protease [Candidatus Binatia bacterium]
MTRQIFNGPPTPEEFQRRLQELMRQHFNPSNLFGQAKQATEDGEQTEPAEEEVKKFKYKPRDVKAYLDRFVIKQEEAKK